MTFWTWQDAGVKKAPRTKQAIAPEPRPRPKAKPKTPKAARPRAVARKIPPRADLGAPIDGWFAKQQPPLRAIVDELRKLVHEAAPEAVGSLKWGMPFFSAGGTLCAISGHKAHVNLILPGPPGTYPDPDQRLEGDGKTGRHLKLRTLADLPRKEVRAWLRTAAALARKA